MSTSKCFGICIKNIKTLAFPNKDFTKNVDEGTLLEIYYTKEGVGFIFRVYNDEMMIDNQMYCVTDSEDVIVVKNQLWPFLVGIKNPVDRSQFIQNHELTDFILGIGINDQVLFKLDKNHNFRKGFVRYIALVPSIGHGLYFGIEVPEYKSKKFNPAEDFVHTIVVAANLILHTEPSKHILLNEDDAGVPTVSFEGFIEDLNQNDECKKSSNELQEEITDDDLYNPSYIEPTSSRPTANVPSSTLVTTLVEDEYEVNRRKHESSLKNNIVYDHWIDATTEPEDGFYNPNYIEPTSSRSTVNFPSSTLVTTKTENEYEVNRRKAGASNEPERITEHIFYNRNYIEQNVNVPSRTFSEDEYEVNRRKHEYSLKKPIAYDDMAGATALPDYWKHLFIKNPTVWICKNCTLENEMTSFSCAACDQPMIRDKPDHLREDEPIRDYEIPFFDEATFPYLDDDNDVVPNHNEFDCSLCLKNCLPNDGIVLRDCIHSFCKTCIRESIVNNLSTRIKCPFKQNYVCEVNLQDREIRGIVGQDIYDEYLARITLEIQKDKNIFNCRNGNCVGYGLVDEQQTEMQCFECKIVNCILCRDIHEGMNCDEFKEFRKQQKEINDLKTVVTFTPHYFQCRNCRQYTNGVYLDRCNHSACKICLIRQLTTTKDKNVQCLVQNCYEQVEERVRQHVLTGEQYERYLFRNKTKGNCSFL